MFDLSISMVNSSARASMLSSVAMASLLRAILRWITILQYKATEDHGCLTRDGQLVCFKVLRAGS